MIGAQPWSNFGGAVQASLFDANTMLAADVDNTPVAKTYAQVLALLSGDAAAPFDWNSQNQTGIVDINLSGDITYSGVGDIICTGDLNLSPSGDVVLAAGVELQNASGDLVIRPGGDLQSNSNLLIRTSTRRFVDFGAAGFGAPAAEGSTSAGDKLLLWDASNFKVTVGVDSGELWLQCTDFATSSIGLYTGGVASAGVLGLEVDVNQKVRATAELEVDGDLNHDGSNVGLYGVVPAVQSAAYTRTATVVESRILLASASATTLNNNNVIAALIADLQSRGFIA